MVDRILQEYNNFVCADDHTNTSEILQEFINEEGLLSSDEVQERLLRFYEPYCTVLGGEEHYIKCIVDPSSFDSSLVTLVLDHKRIPFQIIIYEAWTRGWLSLIDESNAREEIEALYQSLAGALHHALEWGLEGRH